MQLLPALVSHEREIAQWFLRRLRWRDALTFAPLVLVMLAFGIGSAVGSSEAISAVVAFDFFVYYLALLHGLFRGLFWKRQEFRLQDLHQAGLSVSFLRGLLLRTSYLQMCMPVFFAVVVGMPKVLLVGSWMEIAITVITLPVALPFLALSVRLGLEGGYSAIVAKPHAGLRILRLVALVLVPIPIMIATMIGTWLILLTGAGLSQLLPSGLGDMGFQNLLFPLILAAAYAIGGLFKILAIWLLAPLADLPPSFYATHELAQPRHNPRRLLPESL